MQDEIGGRYFLHDAYMSLLLSSFFCPDAARQSRLFSYFTYYDMRCRARRFSLLFGPFSPCHAASAILDDARAMLMPRHAAAAIAIHAIAIIAIAIFIYFYIID